MSKLENHFNKFRENTIGINGSFQSPYGEKKILYADWVASGRLYRSIEEKIIKDFGPFVANTHTETSETGKRMTQAYHYAQKMIKKHVNAGAEDVIISAGYGMTAVINKLQRILGIKVPKEYYNKCEIDENDRPVVFITHMEHHSNHTPWYETIADLVQIEPDENLLVNPDNLEKELQKYKNRKFKIGSFTACSNVTGIRTPYHELAKIMHKNGGLCFVDFAASAPYDHINMHPDDPMEKLDAIFFSPHKFLGGPGSSGIMIFDSEMYNRDAPDNPGGGTVDWTNPWGEYKYVDNIEAREDGGTPGFLQTIKAALAIDLKEKMGVENIEAREKELLQIAFREFESIKGVNLLAGNTKDRLGVISFYAEDIHYNLFVQLLNDHFGIQVRGGCACAGTYGHYLLHVDRETSRNITEMINRGDLSQKPGWVRLSLHPTMTDEELYYIINAIQEVRTNYQKWKEDYEYSSSTNEFNHKTQIKDNSFLLDWFSI
ncbi:MAG: selenocysteine lyase [Marinilabiliales bacterium]|nr:MAG: selenocysteine lyase [Marinilabiliales bacterium]